MRLETVHFQGAVRQMIGRQDRDAMLTKNAQVNLDHQLLRTFGLGVASIRAVTMHLARTASRAGRAVSLEAVSSDLDAFSKTALFPINQARLFPRLQILVHPPARNRHAPTSTKER